MPIPIERLQTIRSEPVLGHMHVSQDVTDGGGGSSGEVRYADEFLGIAKVDPLNPTWILATEMQAMGLVTVVPARITYNPNIDATISLIAWEPTSSVSTEKYRKAIDNPKYRALLFAHQGVSDVLLNISLGEAGFPPQTEQRIRALFYQNSIPQIEREVEGKKARLPDVNARYASAEVKLRAAVRLISTAKQEGNDLTDLENTREVLSDELNEIRTERDTLKTILDGRQGDLRLSREQLGGLEESSAISEDDIRSIIRSLFEEMSR